jgi:hypothetical protein
MSRTTQPKKFTFDFSHGTMHFAKRKDVEDYRDDLIRQSHAISMALEEGPDLGYSPSFVELNAGLHNNLYACMSLLSESESGNE